MKNVVCLILVVLRLSNAHPDEKPKGRLLGSATIQILAPRPDRIVEVFVDNDVTLLNAQSKPTTLWGKTYPARQYTKEQADEILKKGLGNRILGRLADGTTVFLLDVTQEVTGVYQEGGAKGYKPDIRAFYAKAVSLSPSRKFVGVGVNQGVRDWVGLFTLKERKLYVLGELQVEGTGAFRWSPNGKYLAVAGGEMRPSVNVYELEGRKRVLRVATFPGADSDEGVDAPQWSEDSQELYFNRSRPNGSAERWVVDLLSKKLRLRHKEKFLEKK